MTGYVHLYDIPQSVLRHVHSLVQSEFTIEFELVFPHSFSNVLSFPKEIQYQLISPSSSSSSLQLSINKIFYKAVPTHDVTNPVILLSIVYRLFLFCLTIRNTFSSLTRSVQLISVLLQHHILKLSSYF